MVELRPAQLARVPQRLAAVRAFCALAEAQSLAAANKRIGNILRKAEVTAPGTIDHGLLAEGAEQALARAVGTLEPAVQERLAAHDYGAALTLLARIREPVDAFFEKVMVMSEDAAVRRNRLLLLKRLHTTMNAVADISRLSVG